MRNRTSYSSEAEGEILASFDRKTDHRLLFRRLGVCAGQVAVRDEMYQLDLFTDEEALQREQRI